MQVRKSIKKQQQRNNNQKKTKQTRRGAEYNNDKQEETPFCHLQVLKVSLTLIISRR